MTDCSSFIIQFATVATNVYNEADDTLGEIWFEEDYTSIMDGKYWLGYELYLGFVLTFLFGISMSYCCVHIVYQRTDDYQKEIKLKSLDMEPILTKDVIPHLQPHCNHNIDIVNIILAYSNISLEADSMKEYIDSIMTTTITEQLLLNRLCCFIFASTLLAFSYIPIYFFVAHLQDSYRSYVEIECVIIDPSDHCKNGNCEWVWQFDMNALCDDMTLDIDQYAFYGTFTVPVSSAAQREALNRHNPCFINKYNFNTRGNVESCCNVGSRFGNYCDCQRACGSNCCCYMLFILLAVILCCSWCCCLMIQSRLDLVTQYEISLQELSDTV
eukprot:715757_1